MKNKIYLKSLVLVIIILGAAVNIIPVALSKQSKILIADNELTNTLIVDNEGDGDFTSIQAAIDSAAAGDTIEVYSGIYNENLMINKSIDLEGKNVEYLNGTDSGKPVISGILLNNVITINTNNQDVPVKVTNFMIKNAGESHAGIFIQDSESVTISYNDVIQNHHGIQLYYCSNVNLQENFISNNEFGIFTEFSDHCILTLNYIENSSYGVRLSVSNLMTVTQNELKDNGYGLILLESIGNQVFYNNFINNNRQAWFENGLNFWHDNYWSNRPAIIPIFIIIGQIESSIIPILKIPILQFDLRPAATPYDIS